MASRGINKVIIVGNLGNDPEVRHMPNGGAVTNISIATSDSWKDKNTGQQEERTEWHRVVFFNRLAEIAGEYLRKGSKVYVEGRLQTRKWQDQSGQDRYATEIVAGDLQMLDSRGDSGGQAPQQQPQQPYGQQNQNAQAGNAQYQQNANAPSGAASHSMPAPPPQNQAQGAHTRGAPAPANNSNSADNFDDIIPF